MENNYIEFKKERDLGLIITDTFAFIRQNWKEYFDTVLRISGPSMVVFIIAMGYYITSFGGMMEVIGTSSLSENDISIQGLEMVGLMVIVMILGVIFYVLMQISSLYFIKSYINNNGIINRKEIIQNVKSNFWKFLGLVILTILIYMLSFVFCLIPIVYFWVIMSLGMSIMVFETKTIGDTISYCFTLIKNHWWETFGVLIVVALLVWFLGMIFSVPAFIYKMITTMSQMGQDNPIAILGLFSDPIYLGLQVISYLGNFLLASITSIATVFIYYDLNEQKKLTGMSEKIDRLGGI